MKIKRTLAVLVTLVMVLTMVPMSAYAAEKEPVVIPDPVVITKDAKGKVHAYDTFAEAVDAASDGCIMMLMKDVKGGSITVSDDIDFTIDLNKHNLGSETVNTSTSVDVKGVLTIRNGDMIIDVPDWASLIVKSGTVILEDVNVQNVNTNGEANGIAIDNEGGSLEIVSGTFKTGSETKAAINTNSAKGAKTAIGKCSVASVVNWTNSKDFSVTKMDPTVSLNGTEYYSLQHAVIDAESGDTITVLSNDVPDTIITMCDKKVTIDLNGKTLTSHAGAKITVANSNGPIIIKNGEIVNTGKSAEKLADLQATLKIGQHCNVEVDSVTIRNESVKSAVEVDGKLTIHSGTFWARTETAVSVSSTGSVVFGEHVVTDPANWKTAKTFTAKVAPEAIMDGVEYDTLAEAVNNASDGSEIILQRDVLYLVVDAEGVDFTIDLNGYTLCAENVGTGIWINSVGELTMKNGSMIVAQPDWGTINLAAGTLILEDVTVTNSNYVGNAIVNTGGTLKLISGTFVTGSTSEGDTAIKTSEGATTVLDPCSAANVADWEASKEFTVTKMNANVKLNDIEYYDLARAVADAQNGDTITVLTETVPEAVISGCNKKVTIDLNGKTLKSNNKAVIAVENSTGPVIIKNGKLSASGQIPLVVSARAVVEVEDVNISHTGKVVDIAPAVYVAGDLTIHSGSFSTVARNSAAVILHKNGNAVLGENSVADVDNWLEAGSFTVTKQTPEDPDDPVPPEDPDNPVPPEDPDDPVPPEDPDDPVPPEDPDDPVPPEDPDDPVPPEDPNDPVPPEDPDNPVPPEDPDDPVPPEVEKGIIRLAGDNRYATSAEISKGFIADNKAEAILIANGKNFADALAAAPLAAEIGAPILMVDGPKGTFSAQVKAEIDRIDGDHNAAVYIVGGPSAVNTKAEATLKSWGYTNVNRIAGNDRYLTAIEIAKKMPSAKTVFIANGKNFPDALGGGSAASLNDGVILFTATGSLNANTKAYIESQGIERVVILGGTSAVSSNVENQLKAICGNVERVYGANRYTTGVAIASKYFQTADTVIVANGKNFPDALAGGPLAIDAKAPVLLINPNAKTVTAEVKQYIENCGAKRIIVLGGPSAVSETLYNDLATLVK